MTELLFTLTADQLAEWEREKAQLEREIAERQSRIALITEKLKAVAVLVPRAEKKPLQGETLFDEAKPAGAGNKTMIDAVDAMANDSPRPITKTEIKKRLQAMGFPEGSLGNYFYTVIARLKAKDRIRVMPNGDVWRASDSQTH